MLTTARRYSAAIDARWTRSLGLSSPSLEDVAPAETPHVDEDLMDALGERAADVSGPLLDRLERVIQRLSFPTAEKMEAMTESSGVTDNR